MLRKSNSREWFESAFLGFLLAFSMISLWNAIDNDPQSENYIGCWGVLSLMIGSVLVRRRRLSQKLADKVLSEDTRRPVVYLRSFKDDQITSRAIGDPGFPVFYTEEENLMSSLKDFGPCIAIGQPREKLPDLGAARLYLDDSAWKEKVRELLISSKLVVLRAGATPNFLWEVEQSIQNANPMNIILLIPRREDTYPKFRELTSQYFPKALPENIGKHPFSTGTASLYGYIYFDEDWTPHFTKFEFRIPFWQYSGLFPARDIIRSSFTPIYERFGMDAPKFQNNFGIVMVSFLLSAFVLYILTR